MKLSQSSESEEEVEQLSTIMNGSRRKLRAVWMKKSFMARSTVLYAKIRFLKRELETSRQNLKHSERKRREDRKSLKDKSKSFYNNKRRENRKSLKDKGKSFYNNKLLWLKKHKEKNKRRQIKRWREKGKKKLDKIRLKLKESLKLSISLAEFLLMLIEPRGLTTKFFYQVKQAMAKRHF